jgi:uncharacterized protein
VSAGADLDPHLPYPAQIDSYGTGGFRFAGMSHRGSLLCFPDGIWAWPITDPSAIDEQTLTRFFNRARGLDYVLLGTGEAPWPLPDPLRRRFRELRLTVETMPTSAAVRTYNVLIGERRRIGAGLIAVE